MNVLITGCAGFIGSHTVDLFIRKGDFVAGVDCLTYAGNINNLSQSITNSSFVFYEDDICNTDNMIKYCIDHDIAWIINFAAETHVDNSIKSCDRFVRTNVNGTRSLLDCCRMTQANLLHASTDEVYGSIGTGSFREADMLSPQNPYAATKAAAEHLVTAYSNTYGVAYKIVRMSNNFGPRQHKEKFIPTILKALLTGNKIPVYGDGKNIRDWFYVKDCAKMIRRTLIAGYSHQTYNLTYKNERTNIEIVNKMCDIMGKNSDECIEFVRDRLGHDFRYSIDNKKILKIGIKPPTNFEDALIETVDFYRKQFDEKY